MKRLALMLLLLAVPGWAQQADTSGFNAPLAASVFSTAMAFMGPRTIERVSPPDLVLWGLHGVTALDMALTVQLRDGTLVLDLAGKPQFQRAVPATSTPDAWADAAADVFSAAWSLSPALQQAGTQGVIGSFFDEVFNHLDPYSRYVGPAAADVDRARRSGEAGIGLQVVQRGDMVLVAGVNADGPAGDAGVVAGDRILSVDGVPVRAGSADAVMEMLSGAEGSTVVLAVRSRGGRVRTLELDRAVIPPETVFPQRDGDVLTIRVAAFSADTGQRLARELDDAFRRVPLARRPRGLILDLRGNRGGLLRQAVDAAALLMNSGLIVVTEGRNPASNHRWSAASGDVTGGVPIVIVVDGRTASAAEVLAAALSDDGRAVVVGSSTLGKGLVQTIGTLPDGGELFVTWSRVLAPRGWPIQGLGLLPQVCTSLGKDDVQQQLSSLQREVQRSQAALDRHRATRAPATPADILGQRSACPASEPHEADMQAARWLLAHPAAYAAARLPPVRAEAAR